MGDNATLSFERWNLTTITELVKANLLTPSLLPENLFRRFTYICQQFEEFDASSRYWNDLLIPDWKKFLNLVFQDMAQSRGIERCLRLLPVLLIILQEHAKRDNDQSHSSGSITGWLDLMEWAVLAAWTATKNCPEKMQKRFASLFTDIVLKFYFDSLHSFYDKNNKHLAVRDSLTRGDGLIDDAAGSYLAYWHLGRMGLCAMMIHEFLLAVTEKNQATIREELEKCCNSIEDFIKGNPSCLRPVLDIQHIEIFLIWHALASTGRHDSFQNWMIELLNRLTVRQRGLCDTPWPSSSNSWELLFEELAEETPPTNKEPSYLLLMLTELCFLMPSTKEESLISERIIPMIKPTQEQETENITKIDLTGWEPPVGWFDEILEGPNTGGVGISVELNADNPEASIQAYIKQTEIPKDFFKNAIGSPSTYILACLKHQSPIPSWFWRRHFPNEPEDVPKEAEKGKTVR